MDHLYVWKAPADLDVHAATALIKRWEDEGGDPAASPFEPSTDLGWFHRELHEGAPQLHLRSDALPSGSRTPIWMSGTDEAPARVVAIRLPVHADHDALDDVVGLAAKYDLVLFDARTGQLHKPLEDLAAYASATFWPAGAIRSLVAGVGGAVVAIGAWALGIPIASGLVALIGVFMAVLSIATFVAEGRKRLGSRGFPAR